MYQRIRRFLLGRTERQGRLRGAAPAVFDESSITIPGEELYVESSLLREYFDATAFYLSLPGNVFGVVIYPDGTIHLLDGGLHIVPPGSYKVYYVDKLERRLATTPVPELTKDGEKLALSVLVRYRVVDPLIALRIDNPIDMMQEHIQTDIAQYIRTHNHDDIADAPGENKVLSFFVQRHNARHPLSRAIIITGVELKEFSGDMEWVEMRRGDLIQKKRLEIDREKFELQKEIDKIQAAHRVELDKMQAKHKSEMDAAIAEKDARISDILYESRLREIQNELLRQQPEQRRAYIGSAMDAIRQALEPTAYPRNNAEINSIINTLLTTIREELQESPPAHTNGKNAGDKGTQTSSTREKKIGDLTSTLLDWLDHKK